MRRVLMPRLPDDAAAYLALTAVDLWPGSGWNFVFGEASISDRVAVWSLARNGDPGRGDEGFKKCLLRTIKTATHETGHMFSMAHCTAHDCNMAGSNSREESDRRSFAPCPQCLGKACLACLVTPEQVLGDLAAFCGRCGLDSEASFFSLCREKLL